MDLEKSRTYENLKRAFLEEAALASRYFHFAVLADYERFERQAAAFRAMAEGGQTHAQGCFDFLRMARDPDTQIAVGGTLTNLESLGQIESKQANETYPRMSQIAREEGFTDIASWFETLEKAKRRHASKLKNLGSNESNPAR